MRLRAECSTRDLSSAVHLDATLQAGVDLALTAYAHLSADAQYFVALYSFLVILADNNSVSQSVLEVYVSRGETSGNPILVWLAECLSTTHEYFNPYAAAAIVSATIGGLNSMALDASISRCPMALWSRSFVDYRRLQSGFPDAYAMFVFEKRRFPEVYGYVHILP